MGRVSYGDGISLDTWFCAKNCISSCMRFCKCFIEIKKKKKFNLMSALYKEAVLHRKPLNNNYCGEEKYKNKNKLQSFSSSLQLCLHYTECLPAGQYLPPVSGGLEGRPAQRASSFSS